MRWRDDPQKKTRIKSEDLIVFGESGKCCSGPRLVGKVGKPPLRKVEKTGLQEKFIASQLWFEKPAGRLTPRCRRAVKHHSPDHRPSTAPTMLRRGILHFHFPAERLSVGDKQALFTPFCSCEGPIFFHRCSRKWFTCHCKGYGGLSSQNQMAQGCSSSPGSLQALT